MSDKPAQSLTAMWMSVLYNQQNERYAKILT
jgi:hypothetical protein